MTDVLQQLISVLELKKISENHYEGCNEDLGFPNVFGGQVCGQAMMAAYKSVEDRIAHSMHGYFLRAGDPSLPIQYGVQALRDGGSFSAPRAGGQVHLACFRKCPRAVEGQTPLFTIEGFDWK